MRIDLALKHLCLVKSRSIAKTLCDHQAILINGRAAKSSSAVHRGDIVTIGFRARTVQVKILEIPEKQLSKSAAPAYYEPLDEPVDG